MAALNSRSRARDVIDPHQAETTGMRITAAINSASGSSPPRGNAIAPGTPKSSRALRVPALSTSVVSRKCLDHMIWILYDVGMLKPASPVSLSDEQRQTLQAWVRAATTPQAVVLHSRII